MSKTSTIFFDADIDVLAARTRRLADDLARLLADGGPTDADLADAPLLDRWVKAARMLPALAGSVSGHPVMGDRPRIVTSDLFALDADAGWARTANRFYRLGRLGGAARGRDQ